MIHGRPLQDVLPILYSRMSASEIAEEYHVPSDTVTYWARKWKLRHDKETVLRLNQKRAQRLDNVKRKPLKLFHGKTLPEIVSRYYPTMLTRDIAAKFGCSSVAVNLTARKMGIEHSDDIKMLILLNRKRRGEKLQHQMTDELRKKYGKELKDLYEKEKLRLLHGFPQKTKMKVSLLPHPVAVMRRTLCHRRKYFYDMNGDPMVLFYDADTLRKSPSYKRTEEDYARYYGFIFKPAKGYQEENDNEGFE